MAVELFRRVMLSQGNVEAAKDAQELINKYGDIPLPREQEKRFTSRSIINRGVFELNKNPFDPDSVRIYSQRLWTAAGNLMGIYGIDVPPPSITKKELQELKDLNRIPFYDPGLEKVSLFDLSKISSKIRNKYTTRKDEKYYESGWYLFEASPDSPRENTTLEQVGKFAADEGMEVVGLRQYIIASLTIKPKEGYPPDLNTWTRLSETYSEQRPEGERLLSLFAGWTNNGYLSVFPLDAQFRGPGFGARFVKRKVA